MYVVGSRLNRTSAREDIKQIKGPVKQAHGGTGATVGAAHGERAGDYYLEGRLGGDIITETNSRWASLPCRKRCRHCWDDGVPNAGAEPDKYPHFSIDLLRM